MSEIHPPQDLLASNSNVEDEETLLARHRKEKKELHASIQAQKKQLDKKKRKTQLEAMARLEADVEARHARELNELKALKINENSGAAEQDENKAETGGGGDSAEAKQPRVSKAQRRREKKSQEDKDREAQIKAEEALQKDSPRILEDKKIAEILAKRGLVSYAVPPDGDCLYNAVKHQLAKIGVLEYSTTDLRQMTADYIEDNKDSIIMYMTHPDTGDILNEDEFRKYCHQVRNTKAWGGEIEVKALSSSLQCPIEIIQASGTSPVHGEGENPSRKLVLTYHRHMYRLGEHYNSTMEPAPAADGDDDTGEEDDN